MKKVLIIFTLIVIIAAQMTVISSFQLTFINSHTGGTRAVVISKLNYVSMRATIEIFPYIYPDAEPILVTFSNGSQLEITERHSIQVFLPKSGSINGDFHFSTALSFTPLSENEYAMLSLSRNNPMDVDITPDIHEYFLRWYYEPLDSDMDRRNEIDIYWLKVEGDGTISISGYGAPF